MDNKELVDLQVQIDSLRLVVMSLLSAHPNADKVAADATMRLDVWKDAHEARPVTELYLELMAEETVRMNQVLDNLSNQWKERSGHTAAPPSSRARGRAPNRK
jgi:GTP1/Obg family GTP-binding protein